MSYKRVVKKNGKSYGPYIYESYRDSDGNVKKRYLGRSPQKNKSSLLSLFLFAVLIVLVFSIGSYTTENVRSSQFVFPNLENTLASFFANQNFMTGFSVSDDPDDGESGSSESLEENSGVADDGSESGEESGPEDSGDDEEFSSEEVETEDPSDTFESEEIENIEGEVLDGEEGFSEEDIELDEEILEEELAEEEQGGGGSSEEGNSSAEEKINETTQEVDETETNETILNETEIDEEVNETISINETETNITQTETNETLIDELPGGGIYLNDTFLNETNGTFSNETEINGTILNETVLNETFFNETNETILNETLINETLEDNITQEDILEFTTLHYKAVIGRPVKWIKPIEVDDLESSSGQIIVELPRGANNISILKGDEVREALEEVEEYEEIVEEADREEEIVGGLLTGNVVAGVDGGRNLFSKFIEWIKDFTISGEVVKVSDDQISHEIVRGEEAVIVGLEDIVNETTLEVIERELAVEYYTPAPEAVEEKLSNGKRITITADHELNYTDVLAYMLVDEYNIPMGSDRVKFYWYVDSEEEQLVESSESEEEGLSAGLLTGNAVLDEEEIMEAPAQDKFSGKKRIPVDYVSYDFNSNGDIDYIEWIVPHFSDQTYEFIIEITAAEHLDEEREFISDIYNETYLLDGNWSESIYVNEYVRVTFETNLTSERDITIFAREDVEGSNVSVEVYLENGEESIAAFPIINESKYYKIYLTNLSEPADVFDLKIVSFDEDVDPEHSISFDHIIDPLFGSSNISFVDPTPANDSSIYPHDILEINISIRDAPALESLIYTWNGTNLTIFSSDVLLIYNFNNFSALGESETYVNDTAGNNNRAVVNGASFTSSGRHLGAFGFDGINDYMCPESGGACAGTETGIFDDDFNKRTYSFWFKANDIDVSSANKQVILDEGGSGNGVNFFIQDGFLVNGVWVGGTNDWTNASIKEDTWHHAVMTFNTSNWVSYYLDGSLIDSFSFGTTMITHGGAACIGCQQDNSQYFGTGDSSGDTYWFNGTLDEFMIIDRALSATEINLLYMSNFYREDNDNWVLYVNQTSIAGTQWIEPGEYTYSATANDTSSNRNSTGIRTLTVLGDPGVAFNGPTPENNSQITDRSFELNVSINNSQYLDSLEFNWDGTNYSLIKDPLVIFNFDNVSALGENDTYVVDMSGNGNNGTPLFTASIEPEGKYDSAALINVGVVCLDLGGVCDVPDSNPTYDDGYEKRTYSMWVYPWDQASPQVILDVGGTDAGENVYIYSNNIYARVWGSGVDDPWHSAPIVQNNWAHVATTFDSSGNFNFYINGVLAGSGSAEGPRPSTIDPSVIGAVAGNTTTHLGDLTAGYFYTGLVDEFFVFNDSLSADEIAHLYMSNVYKYDIGKWAVYMNKTKNATDLRGYGTHTYDVFAENSYLEGGNVAGERTITIGGCNVAEDQVLSRNLVCSDNLTIVDGVMLSNDGYNITVGEYAKVSGVLNMTSTSSSLFTFTNAAGGFYIGNNGTLYALGTSDSNMVNFTGASGWNMDTAMNITTEYAAFEFMNQFRSNLTSPDILDMQNTSFRNATGNHVVYIGSDSVSRFDSNSVYTDSANSQGIYWDSGESLLTFVNLVIEGPNNILEVNDENLQLNDSNFGHVNLTDNFAASVFSKYHNDDTDYYFIWPGNGGLKASDLLNITDNNGELNISKDIDGEPITFIYDRDDWVVEKWHMPAYGQSSNQEDYVLYFEPGAAFHFNHNADDFVTGFIDYSSSPGDTKLIMYLNGTGWGAGEKIYFKTADQESLGWPFYLWHGLSSNWEVGGKREYLHLLRVNTWWETGEGNASIIQNIKISDGRGNPSFGLDNVSIDLVNITMKDWMGGPTGNCLFLNGSNHTVINLNISSYSSPGSYSIRVENAEDGPNYFINSSFADSALDDMEWADDGTNKSIISFNHQDVFGDYFIAIKDDGPSGEQYLKLSEIANPDFDILEGYNVTLFSGNFIIDEDFNVTGFNLSEGSNENISLEVFDGVDFGVDYFYASGSFSNFTLGNGNFTAYQAERMLIDFSSFTGFDESAGPTISYSNVTNDVIEAFNSVDGGNTYLWRFNQTVVTQIRPPNNTHIGFNVLENITFECNVTDDFDLVNMSFWHDYGGTMARNQTNLITGTFNSSSFNISGLQNETYLNWKCEACDLYECVNSTTFANPIDIDNQFVMINTTSDTNRTNENLSCSSVINDSEGNNVLVDVNWYKEGVLNLSQSFEAVSNGTLFFANLSFGNTTKHDNWSCSMRFDNGYIVSDWVNSSVLKIENSPPTVSLSLPPSAASTTNRTPPFSWIASDVDGDISFTYDWNITAVLVSGGAICSDDRLVGIAGLSYFPTSDLLCLDDNGYDYHWMVRASDGEGVGDYSTYRSLKILGNINLTLTNENVTFSLEGFSGTNDNTTDNIPAPLVIQNDGNIFVNVSINATSLWTEASESSEYYEYKIDNTGAEPGAFNFAQSVTDWRQMPIDSAAIVSIVELNYSEIDTAEIDIYVEVPLGEPPNTNLGSMILFTGSLGE
jgi:hypothetical protein